MSFKDYVEYAHVVQTAEKMWDLQNKKSLEPHVMLVILAHNQMIDDIPNPAVHSIPLLIATVKTFNQCPRKYQIAAIKWIRETVKAM